MSIDYMSVVAKPIKFEVYKSGLGETTQRLVVRFLMSHEQLQQLLAELFIKAGLISDSTASAPFYLSCTNNQKRSFAQIVTSFALRKLTVEQAVIAVNHIWITDAPSEEAFMLVSPDHAALQDRGSFTMVDLLGAVGALNPEIVEALKLREISDSKSIYQAINLTTELSSKLLGNAARLLNHCRRGEITWSQAKSALHFCIENDSDVESCFDVLPKLRRPLVVIDQIKNSRVSRAVMNM